MVLRNQFIASSIMILVVLVACSAAPAGVEATQFAIVATPTEAGTTGDLTPTVEFTLMTSSGHDGLAFIGVGGEIDGVVNPTLAVNPGDVVRITLINGDGIQHDLSIDEFGVSTGTFETQDSEASVTFTASEEGSFVYFCAVPGHRQAGMFGTLQVGEPVEAATGESVVHNPADLPAPIGSRAAQTVRVDLAVREVEGQLADGTTYTYFTYNGTVPGPFIRVRQGDTVEVHMTNDTSSEFAHSIDLHAVTGPGGGAVYTQTNPGAETVFTFQATTIGLYVYHCATPSIPHHISSGMYGLILVEPPGGLPPVDREFYVMQGELYTAQPFGTAGHLDFDAAKMADEDAEYITLNGAAAALASDENALRANVGETIRIYFGVGGPNYTSSFHVIGEIFDRVYPFAALTSDPLTDVQTVSVPPGGAVMVEFRVDVPGRYILVDHALSRLERGLVGLLYVEGEDHPEIFHEGPANP